MTDKPRYTYQLQYLPWLGEPRYVLVDPEALDGDTIIRGEN